MKPIYLEHYKNAEFREWYAHMSPRLSVMLDVLRHVLDKPIRISPHPLALGRYLGTASYSEHNFEKWGEVQAVDAFVDGVHTRDQAGEVVSAASLVGFTGLGVYPDWVNYAGAKQVGFHFGVRENRKMRDPAQWGYMSARMVSIGKALAALPTE